MDKYFLLDSEIAKRLYFDVAADLPIVDYHNHLPIKDLADNRRYENISEVWLINDPYKHRAMRIMGVDEKYITGNSDGYSKFEKWCQIHPLLMGNALYHWSEIELKEYFGIDIPLNIDNASKIWNLANEKIKEEEFSALNLLRKKKIEHAAPCVGLLDDLSLFDSISELHPSLRGDSIINATPSFVKELGILTNTDTSSLNGFIAAIHTRLDDFEKYGCFFPDMALDAGFKYYPNDGKNQERFKTFIKGEINPLDFEILQSEFLRILAMEYSKRNWLMQLHVGALRKTSTRLRTISGPAGGYAGIGNSMDIKSIVLFLDDLDSMGFLPKTQIYTLNPNDHAMVSVLSGSFSEDGISAKVTEGPAWWWCDHYQGMREMLEYYTYYSVLSSFTGMTTDSRSILSMQRHDYFRRVLCQWIGEKVASGEFPNDFSLLSKIVKRISYENASNLIRNK